MPASFEFKRLRIYRNTETNSWSQEIETCTSEELATNEVLVKTEYSSLNYKDALSATGNTGVTRSYPHTPGIDAAGTVVASASSSFSKGDRVLITGYDFGTSVDGGYSEYFSAPASWLLALPPGLSFAEAMAIGTAGFTAALCLHTFERNGVTSANGEVLVTGASGGVGSLSILLLSSQGYSVVACSGKSELQDYLHKLGAKEVLRREELLGQQKRPLNPSRWAAVIDTLGGQPLALALAATKPQGVVASCGLAASPKLDTTVFPFILRGVVLAGIDSAYCPLEVRKKIWAKLATSWKPDFSKLQIEEVDLEGLIPLFAKILSGKICGRVVVKFG